MDGKRSNTEPGDILRKIGELTRSILEHICSGRLPSVYIDRFRNYCTDATGNCFCSSDLAIGKEVVTLQRECHALFQRLANDLFCNRHRCIIITGRGYPDVPTRRFLRLLIEKLSLPAYCLVDCDPYGFDILTTYRFGSMQMAYDAKFLRIPDMHWLGAFPSDSEKYGLPKQCLLPLTAEDKSKIKAMLQRCYLQREVPHWRLELTLLLERGVKFEIEALSVHSISFLSVEYIPTKIKEVLHI